MADLMTPEEYARQWKSKGTGPPTMEALIEDLDKLIEKGGIAGALAQEYRESVAPVISDISEGLGAFNQEQLQRVHALEHSILKPFSYGKQVLVGKPGEPAKAQRKPAAVPSGGSETPLMLRQAEALAGVPAAAGLPPGAMSRFSVQGPDPRTMPMPPEMEIPPLSEDYLARREARSRQLEELRPPQPERRGRDWEGLLGSMAAGAFAGQKLGKGIGAQLAAIGASAAQHGEETSRYDKRQQDQYERSLRAWEAYRLGIVSQQDLQDQARRDKQAEASYLNRTALHARELEIWKRMHPDVIFQGDNVIIPSVGPDGRMTFETHSLDPDTKLIRRAYMESQILSNTRSRMEILDHQNEWISAETRHPFFGPMDQTVTEILLGNYRPDIKARAIETGIRQRAKWWVAASGGDVNDEDEVDEMVESLYSKVGDESPEEIFFPEIRQNVIDRIGEERAEPVYDFMGLGKSRKPYVPLGFTEFLTGER